MRNVNSFRVPTFAVSMLFLWCVWVMGIALAQPLVTVKRVHVTWPTVKVDFTVHCGNQLTLGQQPMEVSLREDGMPIPDPLLISPNPAVDQRFSVAFVLDATSSMNGFKRNAMKQAAVAFADDMDGVQDQACLYWFNSATTLAVDLTTDKSMLQTMIDATPATGTSSKCWDAVHAAVQKLATQGSRIYKTVILVTDDNDNGSVRVPAEILATAIAGDVRICVMTFQPFFEDVIPCQNLVEETGGLSFVDLTPAQLMSAFTSTLTWLREGYRENRISWTTTCQDGRERLVELAAVNVCGGFDTTTTHFIPPTNTGTFLPATLGMEDADTPPDREITLPMVLRTTMPLSYLYPSSFTVRFDTTKLVFRGVSTVPFSLYPFVQATASAQGNVISGSIATPLRFVGAGALIGLRFYVKDHGTRNPVPTVVELTSFAIGRGCLIPNFVPGTVTIQPTTLPRLTASVPDQGTQTFGSIELSKSATRTVTVRNGGGARLSFTRTTISGPQGVDFTMTQGPPAFLDPGQQATVTLRFAPTATGNRTGLLIFETTDPLVPAYTIALTGVGTAAPKMTVSPSSLAFGTLGIGHYAERAIVIQNSGTGPLTISAQALGGTNPGEYAVIRMITTPIAPGQRDSVVIQFAPTQAGARSARYSFASDDPAQTAVTVNLTGTGVVSDLPDIVVNTALLDFGTVPRNRDSVLMIRVANVGTAPLLVGSQTIGGVQAGDFSLVRSCAATVPPLGTDTILVRFAPQASGQRSATLTIPSNDPQTPTVTVTLRGRGGANATPKISLSATQLTFGTVEIGISLTMRVFVSNTGQVPLAILSQKLAGSDSSQFHFGHVCASEIPVGGTDVIEVFFTPTRTGVQNASVVITSNDPGAGTSMVTLRGTGGNPSAPTISFSTQDLDFGAKAVGQSVQRSLIVRNLGTQVLQIQGQVLQGGAADDFAVLKRLRTQIPALGSDTLLFSFTPRFGGLREAQYDITCNDPRRALHTARVFGHGAQDGPPRFEVVKTFLNFGNGTISVPKVDSLLIGNAGKGLLWLFRREITGPHASDFAIISRGTDLVAQNKTSSTVVRFTASHTGQRNATLHVESNDSLFLTRDFSLIGNGVTTGVEGLPAPTAFTLTSSYPHPFSSELHVRIGVPGPGEVEVTVTDALGREVGRTCESIAEAAVRDVTLTSLHGGPGWYVLRVRYRDEVRQAVILRK